MCVTLSLLIIFCLATQSSIGTSPERSWSQLYNQMMWRVPKKEYSRLDSNGTLLKLDALMSLTETLRSIAKSEGEAIAKNELDEVKFWLDSAEFKPEDCRTTKEVEILKGLNNTLKESHIRIPNLEAYVNYLMESLLRYCLSRQDDMIVHYVDKIPQEHLVLISSFGTKHFPPKLLIVKVADYLAPFFKVYKKKLVRVKSPDLQAKTWRIYEEQIGVRCDTIKRLPVESKYAAGYLRHRYLTAFWDINQKVVEWLRVNDICDQMHSSLFLLSRLVPKAIRN